MYEVPEDIELKEKDSTLKSGAQSNDTSHRHMYKVEVEIRYYRKPVLASSGGTAMNTKPKKKKPMMPIAMDNHTQPPSQQSSEKIYQPLIPPKTYKKQEVSAYQDLAFGTRGTGTDVADNSEGQYGKNDEYESLEFGGGGASQEGAYQPLSFQREDTNTYEKLFKPLAIPPVHELKTMTC